MNHTFLQHWDSVERFADVKWHLIILALLFISSGRMPYLAPALDNADPLFTMVITPGFYLHHKKVVDQDLASGGL